MTWRQDVKLVTVAKQLEKELVLVEKSPSQFALEWISSYYNLKPNDPQFLGGKTVSLDPETPVSELLKEIKERKRQVKLDLAKVKQAQESHEIEEPKSKRE